MQTKLISYNLKGIDYSKDQGVDRDVISEKYNTVTNLRVPYKVGEFRD
jgi:hypothetical protein